MAWICQHLFRMKMRMNKLSFDQWMWLSEEIIGSDCMRVFDQYVLGDISFDKLMERICELMPQESMIKLAVLVGCAKEK